jgi:hypothetical protein
MILVLSANSAPAHAQTDSVFVSGDIWNAVTEIAAIREYSFGENSLWVEWLQYLVGAETDGIYGAETYNKHEMKLRALDLTPVEYLPVWKSSNQTFRDSVEVWRPIAFEALSYYGKQGDIDRFLALMQCESGGLTEATNPSSGAAGLLQHLPQYWDARARVAVGGRFNGASAYDGEANIWVSAWLLYEASGGGWQHWNFGCL